MQEIKNKKKQKKAKTKDNVPKENKKGIRKMIQMKRMMIIPKKGKFENNDSEEE
jgi:hypothetical protein